jgi:hypothetical protein
LILDHTCTPADLAASRIDFPAWLDTLRPRDRKIAMKLAVGETTGRVSRSTASRREGYPSSAATCTRRGAASKAKRNPRSLPRRLPNAQLRNEPAASWPQFVGDAPPKDAALAVA